MTLNVVKTVEKKEVVEILGFAYFDTIIKVLGWEKKEFALKFNSYLFTGKVDSANLKALFDMLIELTSLTFSLYKWSVLLVNLKASIFADIIFTVVIEKKHYYLSEDDGVFVLKDLENDEEKYRIESFAKSQIVAMLLYLYSQESVLIDMVEIEGQDEKFSGSYLSFNEDYAKSKKDYINYIDEEFQRYQSRLKDLQKIFLDNFTNK